MLCGVGVSPFLCVVLHCVLALVGSVDCLSEVDEGGLKVCDGLFSCGDFGGAVSEDLARGVGVG